VTEAWEVKVTGRETPSSAVEMFVIELVDLVDEGLDTAAVDVLAASRYSPCHGNSVFSCTCIHSVIALID